MAMDSPHRISSDLHIRLHGSAYLLWICLADYMGHIQAIEDPMVQMEYLKKLVSQHEPFTLKGGGLFHLAFGALLTGSAIGNKKK